MEELQKELKQFQGKQELRGRQGYRGYWGKPRSQPRDKRRGPPKTTETDEESYELSLHKRHTNAKLAFKRKLFKPSTHCITDCVLNLSTAVISKLEISVLSKGLTFIPKPKRMDIKDLFKDAKQFVSRMRTHHEMHNQPARQKSPFYRPKPHRSQVTSHIRLENTIYKLLLELETVQYTQTRSDNLTKNEKLALTNLAKRTDIVINKADPTKALL